MPRGRPPGSKNKPREAAAQATAAPASPGHNSKTAEDLNEEQIKALAFLHRGKRAEKLAAEKKAKAERMNYDKIIKAELGIHGLAMIKELEQLETEEGRKAIEAEFTRRQRVASWLGMSIGTQGALFDTDRRPAEDKAYDDGKIAGMEGKNCEAPAGSSGQSMNEWIRGWHDGQAVISRFNKKDSPQAEIVKRAADEEFQQADEADRDLRPRFLQEAEVQREAGAPAAEEAAQPEDAEEIAF